MPVTDRHYDGTQRCALGLSQYVVPDGAVRDTALELATRIAENAPQTNL